MNRKVFFILGSSFQKWGTLQPEGDRIVILEDTNGDGRADKETVFYQDPSINTALGVCVLGNKVIVSDSPNVFVLIDTNGDGKADKRELLFTGISGRDHDHGVHAFTFGPDGKLYFNMGNEGKQLSYPLTREVPLHGPILDVPKKPVIDLDVIAMVVTHTGGGSNPVVQRIKSGRPESHVGLRKILHHLECHRVDQVARSPGYLIGRAHQIGISRTHVCGEIIEGNVVAAHCAAQAAAVGAGHRIPKADGFVVAGASQQLAVRSESQGSDPARVAMKSDARLAGRRVPELEDAIAAAGCDGRAIRAEGDRADRVG